MFWHAVDKTATYDEINHIGTGYYYWHHFDFERGLEHPPFIRLLATFPLNFLPLQDPEKNFPFFSKKPISNLREYLYGMLLIFRNSEVSAEKILLLTRSMAFLMMLILMGAVYCWSKNLYGENGGLISLFLTATFPPLLGHGSLVTTDVGGTASAVWALYALSRYAADPTRRRLWLCGLALGFAEVCKLSNLMLIPIFLFVFFLFPMPTSQPLSKRMLSAMQVFFICGLIINLIYGFQDFLPPHWIHPHDLAAYQWPPHVQWIYRWLPLPDYYLTSVGFMSWHVKQGFQTFILGKVLSQGVWYYFPFAFLVKTPVVTLLILLAALYTFIKKVPNKIEWLIIFALLFYTSNSIASKLNLGIRHFLFVYPLLFILCGRLVNFFEINRKKALMIFLILFQLFEVAFAAPNFLAYFNLACGGPKAGMRYLSDMDLGQDLPSLSRWLREKPGAEVVLSYFGAALPGYYGIDAQELLPTGTQIHSEKINSDRPAQEFLAVSISHLEGFMTGRETFRLWRENRNPAALIGYSIAVYDITDDVKSHQELAKIYESAGDLKKRDRHLRRAQIISGKIK